MSNELYNHSLFQVKVELLTTHERTALSYQRSRLLMQTYRLTAHDVETCNEKYWSMMSDPVFCLDTAMFTILAAHVGLVIGTLSRHLKARPDFLPLMNHLLRFDTVGLYLLTERGHGLDSFNIETTATKVADGYILHTPREEATKFMPPSSPAFGVEKVALVMARLIVENEDRGSRFFIVPICNQKEMYSGISSTPLPPRSGTSPLDFSITCFDHVHLPPSALVASVISDLAAPERPLDAWWNEVWRLQLGTMTVPAPWISAIKAVAYIGGQYSMHRCIVGKMPEPVPIISFRTQQWPILQATAVASVLENWFPLVVRQSIDKRLDPRVRHAMAVVVKATVCRHFQRCVPEVAERCGAQGTFEHNFMSRIENDGKGVVIAEGDILTLCIRLFSELLLGRYEIPLPNGSKSLLAQHARSLLEENKSLLHRLDGGHRSDSFNSLILPQSQIAIEAIGHALAYSAAVEAQLPREVLDVYQCAVIRADSAWYSEMAGISRFEQRVREDEAATTMLPHLTEHLSALEIKNYISAPIVSDREWKAYIADLHTFTGAASPRAFFIRASL